MNLLMQQCSGMAAPIVGRDRESVANYQMSTKEDEFTDLHHFTFFVGTWNVNGQSPGKCFVLLVPVLRNRSIFFRFHKSSFFGSGSLPIFQIFDKKYNKTKVRLFIFFCLISDKNNALKSFLIIVDSR